MSVYGSNNKNNLLLVVAVSLRISAISKFNKFENFLNYLISTLSKSLYDYFWKS